MAMFNDVDFPHKPISNIQPFTYRDSITYLDKLEQLAEAVNTFFGYIKTLNDTIDLFTDTVTTKLTQFEKDYNSKIRALSDRHDLEMLVLEKKLKDLIAEANSDSVCFNPTNGTRYESLSKVVSDIYDNIRLYSQFAKELDTDTTTAGDFDTAGRTARNIDLYPDTVIRDELKD